MELRRLKTAGVAFCAAWTFGAFCCGAASLSGCGTRPAADTAATPRPLTDAEKAQRDAQARKGQVEARIEQINRSNLPSAEKERLISQVRASGGK